MNTFQISPRGAGWIVIEGQTPSWRLGQYESYESAYRSALAAAEARRPSCILVVKDGSRPFLRVSLS